MLKERLVLVGGIVVLFVCFAILTLSHVLVPLWVFGAFLVGWSLLFALGNRLRKRRR